jgi:hypothetical protein
LYQAPIPSENNIDFLNKPSVCVWVTTNILNEEFKRDKIFVTKWKLYEEKKTTPGQPNPGNPLSKNKASYKTLILT